jgi:putative ABC transport system permease protein
MVIVSFAMTAVLLAAIGLYAVIDFDVGQRRGEIGVRLALGAERRHVVRLVMRRGLALTGVGLAAGIVVALASGRLVGGLLYGITPDDRPTLLIVTSIVAVVAAVATYLPARRAARVDPVAALRAE